MPSLRKIYGWFTKSLSLQSSFDGNYVTKEICDEFVETHFLDTKSHDSASMENIRETPHKESFTNPQSYSPPLIQPRY